MKAQYLTLFLNDYLISVPHTYNYLYGQSISEFQTQIQPQGRFYNNSQRRAPIGRCVKIQIKADIDYPLEHGEVINYTLDGVLTHPVTTKIQA